MIVPNNDIKYDINKRRAQVFAAEKGEVVFWSVAKDKVSSEALANEPLLAEKNFEWLHRHDKESGELYGMLPLVKGMPMALTDHIDRSPGKK